jgi:alkylhydroperoxidase family enzyme
MAALDFAVKLTRSPREMSEADVQHLRAAGFDEPGIVGIAHMTCHFNYFHRMTMGLGV